MRKFLALLSSVALATVAMLVITIGPATSDTFSVASEADYRAALIAAGASSTGPHTINITADFTISGAGDPEYNDGLSADQDLIINGNGHTVTSGIPNVRFLFFNPTSTSLTINDLTVDGFSSGGGGAIESFGDVFLNRCTFQNNESGGDGGAISLPASVNNIVVTDCTFINNEAEDDRGGAIFADNDITVTGSTFVNNRAVSGGSGRGGALYSDGDVTATNSTFNSNSADSDTAGDTGAAIYATSGKTTLTYVTISDHTTSSGETLNIDDGTVFGVVIVRTLTGGVNCTISGTMLSLGYNYSSDASCAFTGTGDTQNGADAMLGALAANGGPTRTMLPASGSPLLDKIPATSPCFGGIVTDQRRLSRPTIAGQFCDIGAVEIQPVAAPITVSPRFTG